MTGQRDLMGPSQTKAIKDLLQSVFVCEILKPSQPLWLSFAWVSDIGILDNSARQFAALCPDWPASQIRLSLVLETILDRGGRINVILREAKENQSFVDTLGRLRTVYGTSIRYYIQHKYHEKGMVGDGFSLDGSMNLTNHGVTINGERLIYRCDKATIAERHIEMNVAWEELLN